MNIEEVQRRLWETSREHKRGRETAGTLFRENPWKMRIRNLYDLMHNPGWIEEACRRVLASSRWKSCENFAWKGSYGYEALPVSSFVRGAI